MRTLHLGEGIGIKTRRACVFGGTTGHFGSGIRTFQNTSFLTRGQRISGNVFGEQNRIFLMKQPVCGNNSGCFLKP